MPMGKKAYKDNYMLYHEGQINILSGKIMLPSVFSWRRGMLVRQIFFQIPDPWPKERSNQGKTSWFVNFFFLKALSLKLNNQIALSQISVDFIPHLLDSICHLLIFK